MGHQVADGINKLMEFVERIAAYESAHRHLYRRFEHWLKSNQHLLDTEEVRVLASVLRPVLASRDLDDEAVVALTRVRDSLAQQRALRGAAVRISVFLKKYENKRTRLANAAWEREIIRLIEGGATVNTDVKALRVVQLQTRRRLVKMLTYEDAQRDARGV